MKSNFLKVSLPDNSPRCTSPSMGLLLLFALFAFFLILTPILTQLLGRIITRPEALMRVSMVVQDLLVFIIPALVTAVAVTRLPARLLALDVKPYAFPTLMGIGALLCSVPVMNMVVEWNQNLHLPESMASVEDYMRQLEESNTAMIDMLMKGASVGSLLVSVLIVGVLAGLSEELFFRGALLRIIQATKINMHLAIWLVAVIFSLLHFQMFGFVPRMLLGAYFGYLVWWTRSLWIPIIIHVFNNSLVVIDSWIAANDSRSINTLCANPENALDWVGIVLSVLLTTACLILIYRWGRGSSSIFEN